MPNNTQPEPITKYAWGHKFYVAFHPLIPDQIGFGASREEAIQDMHHNPPKYQVARLRYPYYWDTPPPQQ